MQIKDIAHDLFRYYILSFLATPVRLLSFYIPKDNNLYVFGAWMGKSFTDNSMYLYNYLKKKDKSKKLVIVIGNDDEFQRLKQEGNIVYKQYSLAGLFSVCRAGLLLVTHSVEEDINFLTISPRSKLVYLSHGTPVKKISRFSENYKILRTINKGFYRLCHLFYPKIDFMFVASSFSLDYVSTFFNVDKERIKIVGFPRDDILKKGEVKKIRQILYAPTFRVGDNKIFLTKQLMEKLNKILMGKGITLLIRVHPSMTLSINSRYKNIIDASSLRLDSQELINLADVLITDYSGIMFDFSLTDKPIIFFIPDFDYYQKKEGLLFDYFSVLPGPFAKTDDELLRLIETMGIWSNDKRYNKKYKKFKQLFNKYQDFKSAERIKKELDKLTI